MAKIGERVIAIIGYGRGIGRTALLEASLREATESAKQEIEDFEKQLKEMQDYLVTTSSEITMEYTYSPNSSIDSLNRELKSIRKRLKYCGYIEAKELKQREIKIRKELKRIKRK